MVHAEPIPRGDQPNGSDAVMLTQSRQSLLSAKSTKLLDRKNSALTPN